MKLKHLILAAALATSAFLFTPSSTAADQFSGVWKLQMTPTTAATQNGAKPFDESLIFEDEALLSENFMYYGFEPGNRGTNAEKNTFASTMNSRTKGTLTWGGLVSGSTVKGILTWTKADGTVWVFSFTGARAAD